jgi:hypothetical protein
VTAYLAKRETATGRSEPIGSLISFAGSSRRIRDEDEPTLAVETIFETSRVRARRATWKPTPIGSSCRLIFRNVDISRPFETTPAAVLEPNSEPGRHNSNGFRVELCLSTRAGLWRAGQEISKQTEI